ncbi:esterase family protein [Anaerobacillus sp. CMMVII]|uniref:alpha/beta hydrolase n=1 Tax=Anaerobacillus sp. CMMVII TaxID=2755588 RepID=UPI0021B7CCB2|nr:alpha/beta hydrolase-fold protein [Anaerobacillus sp. CMMVII]
MTFKGTIFDDYLESRFLKEKIGFKTFLPANYSPLYTYQLLIAQDGDDYFLKGKLASTASELLEQREINNCILVMIPYQSVEDRYKNYHPNGSENQNYIRFLAEELIPYLEKQYHTFELASGRTLMGDSLGATVSLHAAMEYPYTFGQVIAQSPFIAQKTMDYLTNFKKPELLRLYHSIGDQEKEVTTTDGKIIDF